MYQVGSEDSIVEKYVMKDYEEEGKDQPSCWCLSVNPLVNLAVSTSSTS